MEILAPRVRIPDSDGTAVNDLYAVSVWKNLAVAAGWSTVPGYASPQCRILPGGNVVFKGSISKLLSLTSNEVILTIPVGTRPKEQRQCLLTTSANASSMQRFDLRTNGELVYVGQTITSATVQVSLGLLRSDAEQ